MVYHDHYNVKQLGKPTNTDTNTMAYQGYHLRFDNVGINLYIIYRLPSSSVIQFCNELSLILESDLNLATDKTLFVGDFNIHTDNHQDTDTINFLDTINGFNLQNLLTFPTHVKQHHLDLTWNVSIRPLLHPLSTNHRKEPPKNRISYIQKNQSHRPQSIQTRSRVSRIKPTPGEYR